MIVGFMFFLYLYLRGIIEFPRSVKSFLQMEYAKPTKNTTTSNAPSVDNLVQAFKNVSEPGQNAVSDLTEDQIFRNQIQHAIEGLTTEVQNTRKNSYANLFIGGLTTLFAVGVLWSTLLNEGFKIDKPMQYLAFAPRISLALFVEIFSFFFLKLYRRNLDDIKYLTNEITNVKLKLLALRASFLKDAGDFTGNILQELAKTERNFILKNKESTVEIEKMRIDSDEQNKLIENIATIFKRESNLKR